MIGRGEKKRGRKLKESGNEWESRLENVEGNFVGIRGSCRAKKWGVMGERGEEKKRLTHRRGERWGNAEKRIHHGGTEKKWRVTSGERTRRTKKERVKTGKEGIAAETRRTQRHRGAERAQRGIQQLAQRVVRVSRAAERSYLEINVEKRVTSGEGRKGKKKK